MDVLKIVAKLGYINQDDVNKLGNQDESYDGTLMSTLLENLSAVQQAEVLNHLEKITSEPLRFKKYTKPKGKKLDALVTESDATTGDEDATNSKHILLRDNGIASELIPREDLVVLTVRQLEQQFAYSNEAEPPSVDGSKGESKIFIPGFMRQYVENRLPVFVENALQAISMKKDREYMIYEDRDRLREGSSPNAESHHFHRIIPVDFKVQFLNCKL